MPSSCMSRPLLPTGRMPSLSSTGPLPSGEALIVSIQAQAVPSRESMPPRNSPQLPGMSSVMWRTPAGQCRRMASSRARAWARIRTAPLLSMPWPRILPRTLVARVCEESSQRPVPVLRRPERPSACPRPYRWPSRSYPAGISAGAGPAGRQNRRHRPGRSPGGC